MNKRRVRRMLGEVRLRHRFAFGRGMVSEEIDGEIRSLHRAVTKGLDEEVALIVAGYHAWEQANPDPALLPRPTRCGLRCP